MIEIPLNHKTIFMFDNVSYFAQSCGQVIEFDNVSNKQNKAIGSSQTPSAANPSTTHINKSMWTCNIESALEFSRIVYDLFPENEKLIRFIITRHEHTLNSWNEAEQTLEFLMNALGAVTPPNPHMVAQFEGEDFINICKGLNIAAGSFAQTTNLQKQHLSKHNLNSGLIKNCGRIILFTHNTSIESFETMEKFLVKSIEELNRNIQQINQENT